MLNLGRFLWHVSAALLIFLAVAIAAVRLLLLNVHHHSDWFEQWITRTLDRPVSIGELSGEWRGWSPTIRFNELTVYESDKTTTLVHFKYARVDVSITDSIKNRDLTPRQITLGGVEFTLERDEQGNFAIAGLPPSRWPVAKWIEGQRSLNLTDARIRVVDAAHGSHTQVFEELHLAIVRDRELRLISGTAKRKTDSHQADFEEQWQFRILATESILSSDWNGEIFLRGKNVDQSYLMQTLAIKHAQIPQNTMDVAVNSHWRSAKLQTASFETAVSKEESNGLGTLTIHGNLTRLDDGWALGFLPEQFGDETYTRESAPMVRVRWLDKTKKIAWAITDLPIKDLHYAVNNIFTSASPIRAELQRVQPKGLIREASALVAAYDVFAIQSAVAQIESVSIDESQKLPGVTDLDAVILFNEHAGSMHFDQRKTVQLSSNRWLANPLEITLLKGTIDWLQHDSGVTFSTSGLQTIVESFDFKSKGSANFSDPTNLQLDLISYFDAGDLSHFSKIVPKNVMPQKGEKWARAALKNGHLNHGAIAFRGPMKHFPFDHNEGVFKAVFDVAGLELQYSANWPVAEKINGVLEVKNRNAKFAVNAGKIFSSSLDGSSVEIPDLFSKRRNVELTGKTIVTADDVNRFIDESPLKKTNANQFKHVEISGQFGLELDLGLGIFPGGEKDLLGQAHFSGNRIKSRTLGLALEDLQGSVSFTRLDWYGEGLSATFEGHRVGVLLNGGLDDPNYDTQIRLTGTSSAEFLLRQLDTHLPSIAQVFDTDGQKPRLTGSTSWKTVISLPRTSQNKASAPRKLTIESSLDGLEIDLPWPLTKTRDQSVPFSIAVHSSTHLKRISHVTLGERLKGQIIESPEQLGKRKLIGADFVFSAIELPAVESGNISLRGQLSHLDPGEWQPILRKFASKTDTTDQRLPINLELDVNKLIVFGNHFPETQILGKHDDEGLHLKVDGEGLSGEIGAPKDPALPIHLKLSRIAVSPRVGSASSLSIDPRTLRPLSFESLSTKYGDIDLGKVSITTERIENGVRMTHAFAEQGSFVVRGSGDWTVTEGITHSRLDASVNGDSLVGLLGGFGYDIANIEGGATELQLNAFWPGTPADFGLVKLRGHLSIDVESGRFLDIEPGGGRLFGLLSLQTLPRRLSLDFDDLFSKGFTFDSIDGTFSIENGNAYTNSLLMDGPSARILIAGRTGLKEKDYDQVVTVTPALSNSIPVASALFGPAGIGVGAVIYLGQKMFKSIPEQMDKLLSREYSITGDWSSPVIEKL